MPGFSGVARTASGSLGRRVSRASSAKQVLSLLDPPLPPPFARVLAIGLLGSLTMFSIHNMFDNLLVHGVGIQIGVLLGLIGGVSNR